MAAARKKTGGRSRPSTGRVTPAPGSTRPSPATPSRATGVGQPGRRPSNPGLLLLVAVMWIVVGVLILVTVSASWKLIPGVVAIGVGLLFLRGAAATVARRADRQP